MLLEAAADGVELVVDAWVLLFQFADGNRSSNSGDHVLTLRVHQELAVEFVLSGRGIAGEGHACAAVVTEVAEDHRLDVHGGADVVGDSLLAAIDDGAVVVPASEHGFDCELELSPWVGWKALAGFDLNEREELGAYPFEVFRGQVAVLLIALLLLVVVEDDLELVLVDSEHDVGEHHDEAPVRIVDEAFVAALSDQAFDGLGVEPEIEDGVHHAGHRELGPRPHGDEEGVLGIAQALAQIFFDGREGGPNLVHQARRHRCAIRVVLVADLGSDGKPRGDRKADVRHLGQIGALASKQVFHGGVALGEKVHAFVAHFG